MAGFKSFKDLGAFLRQDRIKIFLEDDDDGQVAFLKENNIDLNRGYFGKYNRKNNTVILSQLKNPFTEKTPLVVRLIQRYDIPEYDEKLRVFLFVNAKFDPDDDPENIFVCDLDGRTKDRVETYKQERHKQLELAKERKEKQLAREREREADRKRQEQLQHEQELAEARRIARAQATKAKEQERLQDEKRNIANIINKRNIKSLLHVTQATNLESILMKGVIPVRFLDDIIVSRNDIDRKDGMLDCTSLSIGRLNWYYFRMAKERNYSNSYVCLYIDPRILTDNNDKFYCQSNAASGPIKSLVWSGRLNTSDDFERMFADEVKSSSLNRGQESFIRKEGWPDCWPTDVQAEILYRGIIDPSKIQGVGFRTERELESYRPLLDMYGLQGYIDVNLFF